MIAPAHGYDLIARHAYRHGYTQFIPYAFTYLVGNAHAIVKVALGSRHVQPRFVQPEGLDAVGVLLINGAELARIMDIEWVVRGQCNEVGTFLSCLPASEREVKLEVQKICPQRNSEGM